MVSHVPRKTEHCYSFQSAPLTEARGDRNRADRTLLKSDDGFQSAPLTEARGDMHQGFEVGPSGYPGFNPLPSPKQGETTCAIAVSSGNTSTCFNPLPSPKQGETPLANCP